MHLSRRELLQTSVAFLAASFLPTICSNGNSDPELVKLGFDKIDAALGGGIKRGEMCLIAGYAGTGKSLLLSQIEKHNPVSDLDCFEMADFVGPSFKGNPRDVMIAKALTARSLVNHALAHQSTVCLVQQSNRPRAEFDLGVSHTARYVSSVILGLKRVENSPYTRLTILKNRRGSSNVSVLVGFSRNGIYEIS